MATKTKPTAAARAELLAAVQAERTARLEARRAAADYNPILIWVGAGEDYDLVIADYKASHAEYASCDLEVVSSFMLEPRPAFCTRVSLAQAETRRAEMRARDERARQQASEKIQSEATPWRDRYAAPPKDDAA